MRCIPVIHGLIEQNFVPVIASVEDALHLLQKEFPELEHFSLPSYVTKYPFLLKFKLPSNTLHILRTISKGLERTEDLIKNQSISGSFQITGGEFIPG